jgi:hypothetical protein
MENETVSSERGKLVKSACYILATLLVGGAGVFLIFHPDKGLGIFAVLFAAVLCRVLVINVPELLERREQ